MISFINTKNRSFGLDLLRFFAISLVVYQHGIFLYYPFINEKLANIQLALFGYWGVELFFVLSGFLIGRIFIKIFCSEKTFGTTELLQFWKRRWLRTIPNYYFVLLYIFLRGGTFSQLGKYIIFMQNFAWPNDQFYLQAWSLSIEEWFYLSFPLFTLLFGSILVKRVGKKYTLLAVIAFYIIVSNLVRVLMLAFTGTSIIGMHQTTVFRLDSIMYGVLISWLFAFYKDIVTFNAKRLCLMSIPILFLAVFLHLKFVLVAHPSEWAFTLELLLTPIAFCLLLPYFVLKEFKVNKFVHLCVTTVSIVSYSVYLNHYFVLVSVWPNFQPVNAMQGFGMFLMLSLAILLVSIFQYKLIEEPFLKLRDRRV